MVGQYVEGEPELSRIIDIDETAIGNSAMIKVLRHIDERLTSIEGSLSTIYKAFPNGDDGRPDIEGHCRYHKTMIEMLEERRRLRKAIQEKTISGLVWAVLVGIGIAVWHEIQTIIAGIR